MEANLPMHAMPGPNVRDLSLSVWAKARVRLTTALAWKREVDPDDNWLIIEYNREGLVTKIKCRICEKYQDKLRCFRFFNESFAVGLVNKGWFKKSNLIKHAQSEQHVRGVTMEEWQNEEEVVLHVAARPAAMPAALQPEPGQVVPSVSDVSVVNVNTVTTPMTVVPSVSDVSVVNVNTVTAPAEMEKRRVARLIEIAYNMAKQEIAFESFNSLIEMEIRHGADLGDTYNSAASCQHFIDCIGSFLKDRLIQVLKQVKYFSILIDVFPNSSKKDVTVLVYIIFVNPQTNELETHYLKHAVLPSIVENYGFRTFLESVMTEFGIEDYRHRLIGLGTNRDKGMSIDIGDVPIVPWLVVSVSFSHRLELAVKQSLTCSGTYVDVIMSTFSDLFVLFKNVGSLPRELIELKGALQESLLNLVGGGRWVRSTLEACQLVTGYYRPLITWLESNVDTDARVRGVLSAMKSFKFVGTTMFLSHLLSPLARFCDRLQRTSSSFVGVMSEVNFTILDSLEALMKNCLPPNSDLESLLSSMSGGGKPYNKTPPTCRYLDVELHDVYYGIESIFRNLVSRVESCLRPQLYTGDEKVLEFARILDFELWPLMTSRGVDLKNFGDGLVAKAFNHFSGLLRFSSVEILEEWNTLKTFADFEQCSKLGSELSLKHKNRLPKFSSLIEILRVFPHSPSVLVNCFLTFKRAMSDWRALLSDDTLDALLRIKYNGPPCCQFNSAAVYESSLVFLTKPGPAQSSQPSLDTKPEASSLVENGQGSVDGNKSSLVFLTPSPEPSLDIKTEESSLIESSEASVDVRPLQLVCVSKDYVADVHGVMTNVTDAYRVIESVPGAPRLKTECMSDSEEIQAKRIKIECDDVPRIKTEYKTESEENDLTLRIKVECDSD